MLQQGLLGGECLESDLRKVTFKFLSMEARPAIRHLRSIEGLGAALEAGLAALMEFGE